MDIICFVLVILLILCIFKIYNSNMNGFNTGRAALASTKPQVEPMTDKIDLQKILQQVKDLKLLADMKTPEGLTPEQPEQNEQNQEIFNEIEKIYNFEKTEDNGDNKLMRMNIHAGKKNKTAIDNFAAYGKYNLSPFVSEELQDAEASVWWEADALEFEM